MKTTMLAQDLINAGTNDIMIAGGMQSMPAIRELDLNPDGVNIHGGACAQGHPIGSTGARIIVTLIYALRKLAKKWGIAARYIGGGDATALAVELL